jgi:hypothetical protein
MSYQNQINELFKELYVDAPCYPTYPPYHQGYYLEEMFCRKPKMSGDRYFIPVFWTNVYKQGKERLVQSKLDQLDPSKKYYCVCTHDDAPKETLPPDTIIYSAGGNNRETTPIPLVVSRIPKAVSLDKDVYASFVGSYTHPIRKLMLDHNHPDFVIGMSNQWSDLVSEDREKIFHDISSRSKYILCPRGYGATSYRLYEAFQYGAVPVYISDNFWLPWEYELDWEKLIIKISPEQVSNMREILRDYDSKRSSMVSYAEEIYDEFFSIEGVYNKLLP